MTQFPKKLSDKLARRDAQDALRILPTENTLIDFSSNDYLGFSGNREILERVHRLLSEKDAFKIGATGSRLLSGNHTLYDVLEKKLSDFHRTDSALVFNSGYDVNIGFFGCVPQRGDLVFYDEYIHASIRDGIKMGNAKSYRFRHNDLANLQEKIGTVRGKENHPDSEVYIVTESVFSMDGDSPDLKALAQFCKSNGYRLIVDEAHAVGVLGPNGEGLVQHLNLQDDIFARIVTFGKAIGCHGAAILGSIDLKNYLVNYARSLIYTTGLPPHSIASVIAAYEQLSESQKKQDKNSSRLMISRLTENIHLFNQKLGDSDLPRISDSDHAASNGLDPKPYFIPSNSAIHCCVIPGNRRVRSITETIRKKGFDVKAILAPTVPEGKERLRICLHSFNTEKQIARLVATLTEEIEIRNQ